MRVLAAVLAALVLASCGAQSHLQMDTKPTTGIVGGTLVPENSALAQTIVGIFDSKEQFTCTGSLIGDGIVLTAAHCVYGSEPGNLKIIFATDIMAVLGTSEPDIKAELLRDVASFKYHEKYNPEEQEQNEFDWNDIAVIKFKGTTPAGFHAATVLTDRKVLREGMTATMAGYGVTKVSSYPIEARKVKDIKQKIEDGEIVCYEEGYKDCYEIEMSGDGELRQTTAEIAHIVRGEIRLDESQGHATCSGDSGGPIYIEQNGQYLLVGVTSRGNMMCNKVGVYTSVPYYLDWINFTVKSL